MYCPEICRATDELVCPPSASALGLFFHVLNVREDDVGLNVCPFGEALLRVSLANRFPFLEIPGWCIRTDGSSQKR